MISRLLISSSKEDQNEQALNFLKELGIKNPHPDLLWIEGQDKTLGVKDAKLIREHLSFRPHSAKGKVVVIIGADKFSVDAQNSLLKTLEEPPPGASIILTAQSTEDILPTIISRTQLINHKEEAKALDETLEKKVEELFSSSLERRFAIVDETEDKESLLAALVEYTAERLREDTKLVEFGKHLMDAQRWNKAQGNTRAILEYLMLCL